MNYVKVFRGKEDEIAEQANIFLQQVNEYKHRIMTTKFFLRNDEFVLFIVVNKEPHSHSKYVEPTERTT